MNKAHCITYCRGMEPIARLIHETKVLQEEEREKVMDDVTDEYPNANELQLEDEVDSRMKDSYVDTFTKLFQNNLSFCYDFLKTDLTQRVIEQKERLINQELDHDPDSDEEHSLLLDSVVLSREYIEDLFTE